MAVQVSPVDSVVSSPQGRDRAAECPTQCGALGGSCFCYALDLFRRASGNVLAYRKFLEASGIERDQIRSAADFQRVPITNKANYLRKHPLHNLCWEGMFERALTFTCTSGSTGEPVYFPRDGALDAQASWVHELFYNHSADRSTSSLVLVCFGMGVWIGGILTFQAFKMMGERGYPISILTPGINKPEIFKALRQIAPHFESTIIVGYAPFVKDIVDEAPTHGIDLSALGLRFIFAAEAFTEKFRDYVAKKAGVRNIFFDTMNIYGSADLGAMAFETPLAILMRRTALKRPPLFREVFSSLKKMPTLAQYNPEFIHFESKDGTLLLSGDSSVPLLRYDIGDRGGVWSFEEMIEHFRRNRIDILREASERGLGKSVRAHPFVFVHERSDFSATLYGLKVYPENIKDAFLEESLRDELTGKFTIISRFDRRQNQFLEINVELQQGRKPSDTLSKDTLDRIVEHLRKKNAAFRELSNSLGERAWPRLAFFPHEDPRYFKPGIKQPWVKAD
jgi:phenylacetate-CoA ligase